MEKPDKELADLTGFVSAFSLKNIPEESVERLKMHLLDSLGCAIGALRGVPVQLQLETILALGGKPQATILGTSIKSSVDRSAQRYTALTRYLDFMDNFIAPRGTCHPSDNIGSIMAVCEWKDLSGYDFMEAMAVAYNVQCRMIEAEPSMDKGFDHTTQLGFSIAAGVSKALKFDWETTLNAITLSGVTFNPFVVLRAPPTSHWKGLISSHIALGTVSCCLMAEQGITGPRKMFTGIGGYNQDFEIKESAEWKTLRIDLFHKLDIKKYNAEVHMQSAIEACLHLKKRGLDPLRIKEVNVKIFKTAFNIVGGGSYGRRDDVHTKEEADHSIPYVLAVALLDGQVLPAQFLSERIEQEDVQQLLKKIKVSMKFPFHWPKSWVAKLDSYTRLFPNKLNCSVEIILQNGERFFEHVDSYHGFFQDPFTWEDTEEKFRFLAQRMSRDAQDKVIAIVKNITAHKVTDLVDALNHSSIQIDR